MNFRRLLTAATPKNKVCPRTSLDFWLAEIGIAVSAAFCDRIRPIHFSFPKAQNKKSQPQPVLRLALLLSFRQETFAMFT